MRRFYLAYKDLPKLRRAVAEIPWGQNLLILNTIKEEAWSRETLREQIQSNAYCFLQQEVCYNSLTTSPMAITRRARSLFGGSCFF
ncbi:MAG: hypothetical protein NTV32_00335 [Gammaproteobacteria bacterium]|nr:hypothetical protein [Gammaproteobacteria bacterium]